MLGPRRRRRRLGELAHLVRLGVRGFDREVGHDLGAERLAQLQAADEPLVGRRVRDERRVLEILGPDADDHRLARVRLQARAGARASRAPSEIACLPIFARRSPFDCSIVASSMFIAGLPMKPPTKRFTGRS